MHNMRRLSISTGASVCVVFTLCEGRKRISPLRPETENPGLSRLTYAVLKPESNAVAMTDDAIRKPV
jgi:hypothetical protein